MANSFHIVASGRPLPDASGTNRGAALVYHDVTAARETERKLHLSQKLVAIGHLTGGGAHDFNNVLTVITGTTELLAEGLVDRPDLLGMAKLVDQPAECGAELARKQPLQPRDVDINAMVLDTARLLRPALGEQIEIASMLEDDVRRAHIDPSQLSAALLNLAVNARDAMPDDGKLTLETGNVVLDQAYAQADPDIAPGLYATIAVSDTGTGIPARLRERVFEPFFTTKEVGRGTRLALSMVYSFVKQSGGHIKIYSEEGFGTTIKLYLPPASKHADIPDLAPLPIAGGTEKIPVVENDAMVRDFVVTQLRSLGSTAANGGAALALVDSGTPFDLLFTDVIMPGESDRELANEIAKRRPAVATLYTSG